jgi:hypothetical protein
LEENMPHIPAHTRRWIYGVCLAAVPLLVALGILENEIAPLVIALVGAVIAPGLALANITPSDEAPTRTGPTTLDEVPEWPALDWSTGGVTLRDQINKLMGRPRVTSAPMGGSVTSAQRRVSDPQPRPQGWVHAIDMTPILGPIGGRAGRVQAEQLAERHLRHLRGQQSRPARGRRPIHRAE